MAGFLNKDGVSYLWSKVKAYFAAKDDLNELSDKVDDLVTAGGEPNVITAVKVNGTAQTVAADKSVNITVPTKVSQITNDKNYQTNTDVQTTVDAAINDFATKVSNDDVVNTFKELVDYAAEHSEEAATMAGDISKLKAEQEELASREEIPDRSAAEAGSYLVTTPIGMSWATPISEMSGASASAAGASGLVPAPAKGDQNKVLKGDGTWGVAYTHPTYTAKSSGIYKITVDATGHVSAATAVSKSDITALGIPAQDTTYTAITNAELDTICV